MLISIHDSTLHRVGFMDNSKPNTIHYYNDSWHRYLVQATSTFDFTVSKRRKHSLLQYLTSENYVSFTYESVDYLFNIMKVAESESEITCYCENLNLELINEQDGAHDAAGAKSFEAYLSLCGITDSKITVGINEITDRTRTLDWTGTGTKLERLLNIANGFDAEVEFQTKLCNDGTLDALTLNVYKQYDDTHQGVGTYRADRTLYYSKSINGITRTTDKGELYTAIKPTGKDGLTISSVCKVETADGLTYTTESGSDQIKCPAMRNKYPSQLADSSADGYITLIWDYDTDSADTLYSKALAKLKTVCQPAVNYDIDGELEVQIGDTVTIQDEEFSPILILEARVSEQEISFSDPTNNKNTFSNFRALKNKQLNVTKPVSGSVQINRDRKVTNDKVIFRKDSLQIENADGSSTNLGLYIFPVGAVYGPTYNSTNPSEFLGGTWVLDAVDKVYVGAGGTYTVGSTGGENKHKLTVDEMPKHTHQQYVTSGTGTDAPRSDYVADGNFGKYPQVSTGSAGGGGSHNNMQEFTSAYYWRRTA